MTSEKPTIPVELVDALADCQGAEVHFEQELRALEADLREKGLTEAAEDIHAVQQEATVLGSVGRTLGGVAEGLRAIATRQWTLFNRELAESREVMALLRQRLAGEIKSFSAAEEELVRNQIGDLFRMVPATALALAPVPGIAVVTPFVLRKLGLLPSAWRESHMIHRLEETAVELRADGEDEEAQRCEELAASMRAAHADREDRVKTLREHPNIRLLYDANMDGTIDDEEWALIKSDRELIRGLVENESPWFFTASGQVEGPYALTTLLQLPLPEHTVVSATGLERWVPLDMLIEAWNEVNPP